MSVHVTFDFGFIQYIRQKLSIKILQRFVANEVMGKPFSAGTVILNEDFESKNLVVSKAFVLAPYNSCSSHLSAEVNIEAVILYVMANNGIDYKLLSVV